MSTLHSLAATCLLISALPAQSSLTTTFTSNNGGSAGWSNYFDLTAHVPVAVTALDININTSTAGAAGSIDVYMTAPGGSHVANEASQVWTLMGSSVSVTGNAVGTPTNCPLISPIVIPPGTVGVAIHYIGFAPAYTNGTTTNTTHSNSDLTLVAGSSSGSAPGVAAQLFTPRVWNGTLHYTLASTTGFGTATSVGVGCGGSGPETFFEVFDAGAAFDLTSGFAILPSGTEELVIPAFGNFVTPTGSGMVMRDDETRQVALPFTFPVRGGSVQSLWVCSNGWIALEPTTLADYTESAVELFGGPRRVCAMWDDLNPAAGGTVHSELDPNNPATFHVTFTNVPEFGVGGANTFQYSFDSSGIIEVKYGASSVADCIVGFSHGNGAATVAPTDLSNPSLTLMIGDGSVPLALRGGARPVLGSTATVVTEQIPAGAVGGALLIGYAGFSPGLDLSSFGMPGCSLLTTGQFPVPFAVSNASNTVPFPIGNDARLVGANLHFQSAVIVPGRNSAGLILSNGVVWNIDRN